MALSTLEAPSGKGAGDENFPVASWLIAPALRGHVAAFYAFARAADDIADAPGLPSEVKVGRLERLGTALVDEADADPACAVAHQLRRSLADTGVEARYALDLLEAFKQDATKTRYADWDELMDYCRLSAEPVGRYLLELHGESRAARPYSDALCTALQVLNHLQDCADDYRRLDRVYLPQAWLQATGTDVTALQADASSPALRGVLDRCLAGVRGLLPAVDELPHHLTDRRLAMESGAIAALARALHARLLRQDPLARRVELSRPDKLWNAGRGALAVYLTRRRNRPMRDALAGEAG